MLKLERHQAIIREIKKSSKVLSSQLSEMLQVSEDTIRRDLKDLSEQGLIRKVHGGAILNEHASYIPMKYDDRKDYAHREKEIIAQKAVKLLKDGMMIILDGGTTNLEIAKRLPDYLNLTVVTNCLPIASELVHRKNIQTLFLGGEILKGVPVSVGIDVLKFLDELNADIFFIGTRSISIQDGLSDIERSEVLVKRRMCQRSSTVVSVATSDKLETRQNFSIVGIDEIEILITELDPLDDQLSEYRKLDNMLIY